MQSELNITYFTAISADTDAKITAVAEKHSFELIASGSALGTHSRDLSFETAGELTDEALDALTVDLKSICAMNASVDVWDEDDLVNDYILI